MKRNHHPRLSWLSNVLSVAGSSLGKALDRQPVAIMIKIELEEVLARLTPQGFQDSHVQLSSFSYIAQFISYWRVCSTQPRNFEISNEASRGRFLKTWAFSTDNQETLPVVFGAKPHFSTVRNKANPHLVIGREIKRRIPAPFIPPTS